MPFRSISKVWSHFSSVSSASGVLCAIRVGDDHVDAAVFLSTAATSASASVVDRTSSLWNSAVPARLDDVGDDLAPSFSRMSVTTAPVTSLGERLGRRATDADAGACDTTVSLTALRLPNSARWSGRRTGSLHRSKKATPPRLPRARQTVRAAIPRPLPFAIPGRAPEPAAC